MSVLAKAVSESRALVTDSRRKALGLKSVGVLMSPGPGMGVFDDYRRKAQDKQRYGLYRGWIYSAVHALALKAAGQPVNVSRLRGGSPQERGGSFTRVKSCDLEKMTSLARGKAVGKEWEILEDHPLKDLLESPNSFQNRFQFVYNFVANLNLTGWAFIVAGEAPDGGLEMFSLPTTWVQPDHSERPYGRFKIVNPKNPAASQKIEPLSRENVGFAYMPDPGNPLSALAPAAAQSRSIRIDDHIQTSREAFFENGIFPSVIITLGRDASGRRPRLTARQHRQLSSIVRRKWSSVANAGEPAIIDALIERIDPLSRESREMGWEKSDDQVRNRILSSLGVHPFLLGFVLNVGGHAQAAQIRQVFCDRVNVFLDMLGGVVTNLVGTQEQDERILIWWELCSAVDQALKSSEIKFAADKGWLTEAEFRARLGYPPKEEGQGRSKLLDNPAGLSAVNQLMTLRGQGMISDEETVWLLSQFLRIPEEEIERVFGGESLSKAVESLEEAQRILRASLRPKQISSDIQKCLCCG